MVSFLPEGRVQAQAKDRLSNADSSGTRALYFKDSSNTIMLLHLILHLISHSTKLLSKEKNGVDEKEFNWSGGGRGDIKEGQTRCFKNDLTVFNQRDDWRTDECIDNSTSANEKITKKKKKMNRNFKWTRRSHSEDERMTDAEDNRQWIDFGDGEYEATLFLFLFVVGVVDADHKKVWQALALRD